jgi:GNAT superfamily N-acetyltransferase
LGESPPLQAQWDAYFALGRMTIGPAGSARRGNGWFALVSGEQSAELNVCALMPGAGAAAVEELVGVLGPDLPAVVFRSQLADPGTTTRLEQLGFSTAQEHEPLMVCRRPPTPTAGPFHIRRAAEDEIDRGLAISSEAHAVDRRMLERTLARTPRDAIELWLAWDGAEPISAVWLLRGDGVIGVSSMMTPHRHQRRGAGRALLTAALADTWSPGTRFAVLVATPAGRRLYESIGFAAADEVTTSFRGVDEALLDAIGQGAPPG